MRSSFNVCGFILLCALGATAQTLHSTTEPAVRQVLQRQQEAWNHHDLESFMSGYWNSPDLTFFSGPKISSGWQATIERYRRTYQSEGREMGKLEFSDLNIEVLAPDAALVRGGVAFNYVRRKDASRIVYSDFPKISRWLENHSRPHVRSGMKLTSLHVSSLYP